MKIKENSTLYHFLKTYSTWNPKWDRLTSCNIFSYLIRGFTLAAVTSLSIAVIIHVALIDPILHLIVYLDIGHIPIGEDIAPSAALWTMAIIFFGLFCGINAYTRFKDRVEEEEYAALYDNKEPSFMTRLYVSWRDKMCVKIEVDYNGTAK